MCKQVLFLAVTAATTVVMLAGNVAAQGSAEFQRLLQRLEKLETDAARRQVSDEVLRKRLEALSAEIEQALQANDARLVQIESGLKRIVDQQGRMVKLIDTSVAATGQRSQGNFRFASYGRNSQGSGPSFQQSSFGGEPPAEIIVVIDGVPVRFRRGGRVSESQCDESDGFWSRPEPQLVAGHGGSFFRTASFSSDDCQR